MWQGQLCLPHKRNFLFAVPDHQQPSTWRKSGNWSHSSVASKGPQTLKCGSQVSTCTSDPLGPTQPLTLLTGQLGLPHSLQKRTEIPPTNQTSFPPVHLPTPRSPCSFQRTLPIDVTTSCCFNLLNFLQRNLLVILLQGCGKQGQKSHASLVLIQFAIPHTPWVSLAVNPLWKTRVSITSII